MAPKNKKILIVDDEYDMVEFVKAVLKTRNYDVITAYDGEEGWNLVLKEHPDLVITDLRMPKMSGLEFCKRIRANSEVADTLVLVMSSLTTGMDKPDAFWSSGLGSDDFLAKPFDPLSLLGRVEYLLRKDSYVSNSATGSSGQKPGAGAADVGTTSAALGQAEPEEVVRVFVESWNTRDFAREYSTLDGEMIGGLSREDYIQRRTHVYAQERGDMVHHRVLDTDTKISNNMASVACLREDIINGIPRPKDERYVLKKTNQGWKIVSVKSRPISFNIE